MRQVALRAQLFARDISTHALTWSATPTGCGKTIVFAISTHALTWSATPLPVPTIIALEFQLTHSRGVRRTYDIGISAENKFQLTHSRGVRPFIISQNEANGNFNSRTHVECDDSAARKHSAVLISTHALTWSATEGWVDLPRLHENFNSRTHVECDSPPLHLHTIPRHFNSRTHVECDCPKVKCPSSGLISTHALTWSATQRRQSFVHG